MFGDLVAPSPRVSLEAIIARDPDVIIYPMGGSGPAHAAGPAERPGWENLRAVEQGAVLEVPSDLMHRLGPRVGQAARILAEALHPEIRVGYLPEQAVERRKRDTAVATDDEELAAGRECTGVPAGRSEA